MLFCGYLSKAKQCFTSGVHNGPNPKQELDVALELFNSELKKLKSLEKEQAVIKKAERKKADAVKALQEAEKNPDLSSEEKHKQRQHG